MGKDRLQFPDLPTTVFENTDPLLLNEIILKACELNPKARYQSAAEMHQDLSAFTPMYFNDAAILAFSPLAQSVVREDGGRCPDAVPRPAGIYRI